MNILIPYSWLKDYISTKLSPLKIAEGLSLHSFSVEKTIKEKEDFVFEIEVTPNRGDALSVIGIARELKAIFPEKVCKFKEDKFNKNQKTSDKDKLEVQIKDKSLVPRFVAIILDNVKIKRSPLFIEERLKKVGIRPINNIVDITNYLMIDRGQPMHAFDYEKIRGKRMIIRESKKGEKIVTLDGVERILPQGVIVIEDGAGRLIDLCGIMGAQNSEIEDGTKKVLLFVQIYDPIRIRKASMALGHRTDAALRFEKGIDEENVLPSLWRAAFMAKKYANSKISSNLIDIKNVKTKKEQIKIDYEKINLISGINIDKNKINSILKSLGFKIKGNIAIPPSWREGDIQISEDLAEEVIRIYGYHNIPSMLFNGDVPNKKEDPFFFEDIAKNFLKYMGFYECYNPSMTKKENVKSSALELLNPLNQEATHLRDSLIPQLLEVVEKNKERKETIKVFELSSVFLKNKEGLPSQPLKLGIVVKGIDYLDFKGLIESLFDELGIKDFEITIKKEKQKCLSSEIDFEKILKIASISKKYKKISNFSPIKEDITLVIPPNIDYSQIKKNIIEVDKRIDKLEFKYFYKNFLTLSIEYLDTKKQISSEDTSKIRENIFNKLLTNLGVSLKK